MLASIFLSLFWLVIGMVEESAAALDAKTQHEWKNLAPGLVRQRIVIECTTPEVVSPEQMKEYLRQLSKTVDMKPLSDPFVYAAPGSDGKFMGWGGWQHWVTSGAHAYSYPTEPPLFTVDAYTCKPFSVEKAVEFTRNYLKAKELVWMEVDVNK